MERETKVNLGNRERLNIFTDPNVIYWELQNFSVKWYTNFATLNFVIA